MDEQYPQPPSLFSHSEASVTTTPTPGDATANQPVFSSADAPATPEPNDPAPPTTDIERDKGPRSTGRRG